MFPTVKPQVATLGKFYYKVPLCCRMVTAIGQGTLY
jgi:hypothetical protein